MISSCSEGSGEGNPPPARGLDGAGTFQGLCSSSQDTTAQFRPKLHQPNTDFFLFLYFAFLSKTTRRSWACLFRVYRVAGRCGEQLQQCLLLLLWGTPRAPQQRGGLQTQPPGLLIPLCGTAASPACPGRAFAAALWVQGGSRAAALCGCLWHFTAATHPQGPPRLPLAIVAFEPKDSTKFLHFKKKTRTASDGPDCQGKQCLENSSSEAIYPKKNTKKTPHPGNAAAPG